MKGFVFLFGVMIISRFAALDLGGLGFCFWIWVMVFSGFVGYVFRGLRIDQV